MLLSWESEATGHRMDHLIPWDAKRGLAIFAHPDDETLWCGGLLSRGDLDWTVVCCSIPEKDPERAYKFFGACSALGVTGRLLPFGEKAGPFRLDMIDTDGFDVVLTHGVAGEYGHPQHKELHERLPMATRHIGYGGEGRYKLPLSDPMKHRKMAALRCYDHVSPADDGKPKWEALLEYYGKRFDVWRETYD